MKKEHHLQRPKYKITRGLKKKRKKKKQTKINYRENYENFPPTEQIPEIS